MTHTCIYTNVYGCTTWLIIIFVEKVSNECNLSTLGDCIGRAGSVFPDGFESFQPLVDFGRGIEY